MIKKSLLGILTFALILVLAACNTQKEEPAPKPDVKKELEDKVQADNESITAKPKVVEEKSVEPQNKMMGTWVGTLDKRKATLVITEENKDGFKGKITINYRNPIKQEIEGSIADDGTVTMKDLLHSRYKGTYDAKLIENDSAIRGVFTTIVDKKKFDFVLTKQK